MAERAGISSTIILRNRADRGADARRGGAAAGNASGRNHRLMCHPGYVDDDLRKTKTRLQARGRRNLRF